MRKFKLINSSGEWDLCDKTSFFRYPSGLGLSRKIRSVPAGSEFIQTENELEQKIIPGEIVFKKYSRYSEFIAFCNKTPLTLCYMPNDKWYYIDVEVKRIIKGEKSPGTGLLLCPIDFLAMSTWYDKSRVFNAQMSTATGKKYPYTYPYTYLDTTAGSAIISNTGQDDSPVKLHIFGEVINPSWALIRDGVTVMTGKVNATIPAGNKLVVESSPKAMEIAEYTIENVFVRNLCQNSDFGTERFIYAPSGNSTITFAHEGGAIIKAAAEVKQLADTV